MQASSGSGGTTQCPAQDFAEFFDHAYGYLLLLPKTDGTDDDIHPLQASSWPSSAREILRDSRSAQADYPGRAAGKRMAHGFEPTFRTG